MTRKRWTRVVALVALIALGAACSGGDDINGVYRNDVEGTVEIKEGGEFVLSQEGSDPVEATFERDGDEIIVSLPEGLNASEIRFEIRDGDLVAEPGAYSGDEETVFEKE